MKKTLSLILAALLCASMTSVAFAEEATTEKTAVETVENIPAEAGEEVVASTLVYVDVEAVVALAAEYNIVVTPEIVLALLNSGIELTFENIKNTAALFGIVLPDEFITALIELIANTPAPIADVAEEVAVEEVAAEDAAAEDAAAEEVVAEEVVAEEAVAEEVVAEEAVVEEVAAEEVVAEEAVVEEAVVEEAVVITLTNDPFLSPVRKTTKANGEKTLITGVAANDTFLAPVLKITKANGEKTLIAGVAANDTVFLAPVVNK